MMRFIYLGVTGALLLGCLIISTLTLQTSCSIYPNEFNSRFGCWMLPNFMRPNGGLLF